MRVYFTNLGCKLNQAELERMAREFVAAGHRIAPQVEEADVHVVNTCTVTHVAARDSRKIARRGHRRNPSMKTVLTGCYVAAEPDAASNVRGVDLIVSNEHKASLLQRVHQAFPELRPDPIRSTGVPYVPLDFGNSRAAVKIEDGCNMRCSFCIIPLTRGRQQSRPPGSVIEEVAGLIKGGFEEIVITGVQISSYRYESWGLFELVQALLRQTSAARLRLTSIAPWDFDPRLLELFAGGRLCRHVHLSLQSGCEQTLRRMRRPYTPTQFAALLTELRSRVPGLAVTTDVIVGFPGETRAEFESSIEFVRSCAFSRIHAFPYSERPGTDAPKLGTSVPVKIKRDRMNAMLEVARHAEADFRARQVGQQADVLWERRDAGRWIGMTDNYVRVQMPTRAGLDQPRLETVALTGADGNTLIAEPINTRQTRKVRSA